MLRYLSKCLEIPRSCSSGTSSLLIWMMVALNIIPVIFFFYYFGRHRFICNILETVWYTLGFKELAILTCICDCCDEVLILSWDCPTLSPINHLVVVPDEYLQCIEEWIWVRHSRPDSSHQTAVAKDRKLHPHFHYPTHLENIIHHLKRIILLERRANREWRRLLSDACCASVSITGLGFWVVVIRHDEARGRRRVATAASSLLSEWTDRKLGCRPSELSERVERILIWRVSGLRLLWLLCDSLEVTDKVSFVLRNNRIYSIHPVCRESNEVAEERVSLQGRCEWRCCGWSGGIPLIKYS